VYENITMIDCNSTYYANTTYSDGIEMLSEAGLTSKTTSLNTTRLALCPEKGSVTYRG
jgi:hypothetical protein